MTARAIGDYAGLIALLLLCIAATLRASRVLGARVRSGTDLERRKDFGSQIAQVALPVAVTDRCGQFVSGLRQNDFRVFENGTPQTISAFSEEHLPVTVGLVLDASESMRAKRPEVAAAAISFIESSHAGDEIFVVNFNERALFGLPSNVLFSNNVSQLEEAIRGSCAEGETALYDAILLAMERLKLGTRERKSLLVISDGDDNKSRGTFREVLAAAERDFVLIYTLAIVDKEEAENSCALLQQLATLTGGTARVIRRLHDIRNVGPQIARELHEQYTLVYSPSNVSVDGTFRTVRVVAQTPAQAKLCVRTRVGYVAADSTATSMTRL